MKLQSLAVGSVLFCIGLVGLTAAGCTATVSGSGGTSSGSTRRWARTRIPTGAPSGCNVDSALTCSSDALGVSCTSDTAPDSSTLICSDGVDNGDGTFGYCCVDWTGGSCTPDASVSGCAYPSYGFSCPGGGDSPDRGDPALICSTPTAGSEQRPRSLLLRGQRRQRQQQRRKQRRRGLLARLVARLRRWLRRRRLRSQLEPRDGVPGLHLQRSQPAGRRLRRLLLRDGLHRLDVRAGRHGRRLRVPVGRLLVRRHRHA